MSKKTFRGRVVLAGELSGKATVSRHPFNTSGSYQENMFGGRTDSAPCTDASNDELFGKDLSNMILCTTTTVGSTMGGMLGDEFLETIQMGDPIAIHEDGTVEIG